MRVTKAKMTIPSADPSKSIAKRAVLLAFLVASASTAVAQQPSHGLNNSRFQNTISAPRIVRQGARIAPEARMGAVRSNPFFSSAPAVVDSAPSQGFSAQGASQFTPPDASYSVAPSSQMPGGSVRTNHHLRPDRQALVNDTPLIDMVPRDHGSAGAVDELDRFGQDTSNAFVRQRRRSDNVQDLAVGPDASSRSPIPLAMTPDSAEPIQSVGPGYRGGPGAPTDNNYGGSSHVIPVADARDSNSTIQETQPIFFSLSDDVEPGDEIEPGSGVEPGNENREPVGVPLGDETDSDAPDLIKKSDEDETKSERTLGDSGAEPDGSNDSTHDADEPKAAGPSTETVDPSTDEQLEQAKPTDETAEATGAETEDSKPLAAIDTPVKLAPVLNLSEDMPLPEQLATPGRASQMRFNPNVQQAEDSDHEQTVQDLVASKRSRIPIANAASAANSVSPAPPTVATSPVSSAPVAISSPPMNIERGDDSGAVVQPAIEAAIAPVFQPPARLAKQTRSTSTLPTQKPADEALPELSRSKLPDGNSASHKIADAPSNAPAPAARRAVEPKPTPHRSQIAERPRVTRRDAHAVLTVAPILEQFSSDEAPLIGAPVAVDPTQVSAKSVARESRQTDGKSSVLTQAKLASSKHNLQRHSSVPTGASKRQSDSGTGSAASEATKSNQKLVVLQLSRAQVRSMTIGGQLRNVEIADTDICQAFASGTNQIKLIGTGIGKTELTIWADVAEGEPTRVQTFVIEVNEAVDATGDKVSGHTDLLNDSIDKAFPTSSVVVSKRGGELVVTGHCDDEETAKQIIRLVRKSCLVPVQDNLKVR